MAPSSQHPSPDRLPTLPDPVPPLPDPVPTVAALVLSYNGLEVTLKTLSSLVQLDYPAYDLILLDNGSIDGTREAVAEAYPQVRQIRVEENQGISHGVNVGLLQCVQEGYDHVLLLNNDIEADPAMVTELVRAAEAQPEVGVVGPKAYYYWDRERVWSAGGILRYRESITRERGDGEIDQGQFDRDQEVAYVNGCAMLMRRQALIDTGLWDTAYFLGVEDADWCARMKKEGWRCYYAHRAVLWHMIGFSAGVYKPGRTFHTGRSSAIFVRRHARLWQRLSFLAFTALAIPLAWLRELPKGNQRAATSKLKGVLQGLRSPLAPPPEPLGARDGA